MVSRGRRSGWIAPANPASLPEQVQNSKETRTAELHRKAAEHNKKSWITSDVLYFRMCDRRDMDVQIETDMEVRFKVFVDYKGARAIDVKPA